MRIKSLLLGILALLILALISIQFISTTPSSDNTGVESTAKDESVSDLVSTAKTVAPDTSHQLNAPVTDAMRSHPLQKKDLAIGAGKQAGQDSKVSFHIMMQQMDGKVVFDSKKDGRPWTGSIGDGSFISGIDIGLRGMFVGGRRSLWIPPHLAYGSNGIPGQVPPNAQLYAEIEVLSIF
jgi:FKBP-type peptidyl-prolyl cis-trans isomerase